MAQFPHSSFLFCLQQKPETLRYYTKALTLQVKCIKNIFLYYNKSVNSGDTSDFIANVEILFVCCDKLLEDTIQRNF